MKNHLVRMLFMSAALAPVSHITAQDSKSLAGCYRFDSVAFTWTVLEYNPVRVHTDSSKTLQLFDRPNPLLTRDTVGKHDIVPTNFTADSMSRARKLRYSYWKVDSPTRVTINWFDGLHGLLFGLDVKADTLVGQVEFLTDVANQQGRKAAVRGVKVACG